MKLRLDKTQLDKPKDIMPLEHQHDGYTTPINWWQVTTEGDCEGRTTKDLGDFYGHMVEIAFHLADKVYYSLTFKPIDLPLVVPTEYPKYVAKESDVWISFYSNTPTAATLTKWFDTDEVTVAQRSAKSSYYNSVYLTLNKEKKYDS